MTGFNLKVKIHKVDPLFVGEEFRTSVWISEQAVKTLRKCANNRQGREFIKKLKYYARSRFRVFEREGGPVRHEGDGVWTVAYAPSLFRLIGFYVGSRKAEFVVVDAFTKHGQKLSASERKRIKEVVRAKRGKLWSKRSS